MADYNRDEMRRQELRITSAEPKKKPIVKAAHLDIEIDNSDALKFWSDAYQISSNSILQKYEVIDLASIQSSYKKYRSSIALGG